MVNGICVACATGYFTRNKLKDNNSQCIPCPNGFFGRHCINWCNCNQQEKCDRVFGCVQADFGYTTTVTSLRVNSTNSSEGYRTNITAKNPEKTDSGVTSMDSSEGYRTNVTAKNPEKTDSGVTSMDYSERYRTNVTAKNPDKTDSGVTSMDSSKGYRTNVTAKNPDKTDSGQKNVSRIALVLAILALCIIGLFCIYKAYLKQKTKKFKMKRVHSNINARENELYNLGLRA